jgi:hypothetical protein
LTEVPELEEARAAGEAREVGAVTLDAVFEGAFVPKVEKKSETHFVLDFEGKGIYWWMFRLKGVAGKTVRVDLKGVALDKWLTLNPLYQNASEARSFMAEPLLRDDFNLRVVMTIEGHNGTRMPAEAGMGWRYIPEVWAVNGKTLCFVQTFQEDEVKVAMRVPFTLSDEAALMAEARRAKAAEVEVEVAEVGKSVEGRALHVVKVSSGGDEGERTHPCILMYAREHADEQDSSWAVAGALRRVLANDETAKELRAKFTFMFIPVLDVDSAAISRHAKVFSTFLVRSTSPESLKYGEYFQKWMRSGKSLTIVFNFHNMESAEGVHLVPPLFPRTDSSMLGPTKALHNRVSEDLRGHGFTVGQDSWDKGESPERLGGWISATCGAVHLPYELNLQESNKHLRYGDISYLGWILLRSSCTFLGGTEGPQILDYADAGRSNYLRRWRMFGDQVKEESVFAAERRLKGVQASAAELDAALGLGDKK